jgi:hypothetical protein
MLPLITGGIGVGVGISGTAVSVGSGVGVSGKGPVHPINIKHNIEITLIERNIVQILTAMFQSFEIKLINVIK